MVFEIVDESPGADVSQESAEAEAEAKKPENEAESPTAEETEDKPDPFQERIDKLTKNWRETQRQLQAKEDELSDMRKRIGNIPVEQVKTLEDFEYDQGKYIAYLEERFEKRAEAAAERVASRIQGQTESERNYQTFLSREKKFASDRKDYHSKVNSDWPCSPVMASEIHQSEIGPELSYHLATNPDVALEIAQLPERAQVRRIAQLEGRLRAKPAEVSKAPPPPPGIKASEPGVRVSTRDPKSDKLSDSEWLKRRNAEIAKKG